MTDNRERPDRLRGMTCPYCGALPGDNCIANTRRIGPLTRRAFVHAARRQQWLDHLEKTA